LIPAWSFRCRHRRLCSQYSSGLSFASLLRYLDAEPKTRLVSIRIHFYHIYIGTILMSDTMPDFSLASLTAMHIYRIPPSNAIDSLHCPEVGPRLRSFRDVVGVPPSLDLWQAESRLNASRRYMHKLMRNREPSPTNRGKSA